ncbi:hypothetical protein CANARDRAFT_207609 [[Candida] arabinofermentans NRRL YB-2248]|uniref:Phospholipid/glycerol acyltransferase domain-containing protein n=1 Tax=[Candida] arabinofermentans NRRL YB-2248 TaxID=983967 RepID=A0A1E4T051_9ASCO|nr:hypothetical protein CANARDRAFT_207609 [[Candida] arabinofermentans NRRL YB-2248]
MSTSADGQLAKAAKNDHKKEKIQTPYQEPTTFRRFVYDLVLWIFTVIFDCFFREIRPRGAFRLPKSGPIIFVAAPHANQFVDPIVLMGQVKNETGRRISFLIAEKSHKRKFIGLISRSQMSIPVRRAQDNLKAAKGSIKLDPTNELRIIGENTQFTKECEVKGLISLPKSLGSCEIGTIVSDTEIKLKKPFRFSSPKTTEEAKKVLVDGTSFKVAPRIDQSEVYSKVFEHLSHGHCLGLFSEGGSHDRPDLLPLKAGVAIMALGAMEANPNCNVKIVPCGMNYFHPHKFRSRAVVEFGKPIEIEKELVTKYSDPNTSKDAIRDLLDTITKGLKSVTVTCPDYESLVCVQVARRLYSNNLSSRLSLSATLEMNRRLIKGYLHFKDEPKFIELKKQILAYNESLKIFKIPDHLVEQNKSERRWKIFIHFVSSLFKLIIIGAFALPGIILFSPVFIASKRISEKKRKEALAGSTVKIQARDVIATWKILVSIGMAPLLYTVYAAIGSWYIRKYWLVSNMSTLRIVVSFYVFSVVITYSALIFGDKGTDSLKSIRPLWLALVNKQGLRELQATRQRLSLEITQLINEYGPELFPDFNLHDYEKKQELRRIRREERKKRHQELEESGLKLLDSEDEYEEQKTQKLRQRQQTEKSPELIEKLLSKKLELTSSVPIISNDGEDVTSSVGLSSSSEFENVSTSESSESDYDGSKSDSNQNEKFAKLGLIRDQIIKENRKRDAEEDNRE